MVDFYIFITVLIRKRLSGTFNWTIKFEVKMVIYNILLQTLEIFICFKNVLKK